MDCADLSQGWAVSLTNITLSILLHQIEPFFQWNEYMLIFFPGEENISTEWLSFFLFHTIGVFPEPVRYILINK